MRPLRSLLLLSLLLLASVSSQAGLITTASGITSPVIIDFSQYSGCTATNMTECDPPVDVGGLVGYTVTLTGGAQTSAYNSGYGLDTNGTWDGGRIGYAMTDAPAGWMRFTFTGALFAGVGGLVNYSPEYGTPTLVVFDSEGNELESYDLSAAPISTPSGLNAGEFRGIGRSSADIAAIEFRNAYVVVDDLTFGGYTAPVPEPASLALVGFGLLSLGFCARRRR